MAMAPHLLNGIVYCLRNGLFFFARQEDIDKPRVFWYSIKRPLGPCWCGAMAAQLICNQWVAGSTPVTSSKKDPAIYRQNGGVYRGIFAFLCVVKRPESATARQVRLCRHSSSPQENPTRNGEDRHPVGFFMSLCRCAARTFSPSAKTGIPGAFTFAAMGSVQTGAACCHPVRTAADRWCAPACRRYPPHRPCQ